MNRIIDRIQAVIEHIEVHLAEKLHTVDLAAVACLSPFHFQRTFHAICGLTLQDYVRRRRLSRAALMLRSSRLPILHVALECGYGSNEAFSRAFEAFSGSVPSRWRTTSGTVALQSKLFLGDLAASRVDVPPPCVMHRPEVQLVGRLYRTSLEGERYFSEIPGFYEDFGASRSYLHLPCRAAPEMAHGVSCHFGDDGRFDFLIGEPVSGEWDGVLPAGFTQLTLPGGPYACFTANGPAASVPDTWRQIYGHWLPHAGVQRGDGPDWEVTDVRASAFPDAMRVQIFIPLN